MNLLKLIGFEAATRIIQEHAAPLIGGEQVPVPESRGRVLSAAVTAPYDVPGYPKSQMDGYAVRASDLSGAAESAPVLLELVGMVHAGDNPPFSIVPGTCAYVATGAAVPEGADAVVMREDCGEGDSPHIAVRTTALPGQHIMAPGFDLRQGTALWPAGCRITPRMIGVMSGAGIATVECVRRPRVAVISTGNEIVRAGEERGYGKTHDANAPFLCATTEADGAEATYLGIAADDPESLRALLSDVRSYDMVLLSAGVSKGHRDHVLDAIADVGDIHFHGVAVKPGKPTVFATAGSTVIFGLPGHPTSCFTIYSLLARPALLRLMGMENPLSVSRHPLSRHLFVPKGRKQFLPVRFEDGTAVPLFRGSGALSSFQFAEGFAVLGEHDEYLDEGDIVDVIHLGE